MQIRYFDAAWNDIKNSPGWFGKLCLLALVNFIPVFGQMVTYGYLYGWAREISWGAHRPMPSSLFGNEDGKYWRRGWFVLVLTFVLMLIPIFVMTIGQTMQVGVYSARGDAGQGAIAMVGGLLYVAGIVLSLLVSVLVWIGSMRVSIYDRLSAGFQLGKLWKMLLHDTGGIMRIFGMNLLVSLIIGIALSIVITVLMLIVVFAGLAGAMSSGYSIDSIQYMTDAQAAQLTLRVIASAGVVGFFSGAIMLFVVNLGSAFTSALVYRAVGYWTMQFDVPAWRGQDDPMPFELVQSPAQPGMQQDSYPGMQPQGQPQGQYPSGVIPMDPQQMPVGAMPQSATDQTTAWQQAEPLDQVVQGPVGQVEQPAVAPEENSLIDQAVQSVQDAQDAVAASPEVQAYDAQVAAWQSESAGVSEDDVASR